MLNEKKILTEILKQWIKDRPLGTALDGAQRFVTANIHTLTHLPEGRDPFDTRIYKANLSKSYERFLTKEPNESTEAELTDMFREVNREKYRSLKRKADGRVVFIRDSTFSFMYGKPTQARYFVIDTEKSPIVLITDVDRNVQMLVMPLFEREKK